MGLLAQPWVVKTRNRVRHIGVAQAIYQRWMAMFDYEERFARELLNAVDSRSVVWDVGANVGLYTQQFLAKGARQVVCVEPAPAAVESLRTRFANELRSGSRLVLLPMAFSDASGTARMAANGASPTNQLKTGIETTEGLIEVPIARADEMLRQDGLAPPNVLKIDVEGYELEVLRGFGELIRSSQLRAVFIEVHFALLHERGLDQAPVEISSILKSAGFKVRWLDLSHISGIRA